jgi:hypothetical protein
VSISAALVEEDVVEYVKLAIAETAPPPQREHPPVTGSR